MVKLTIKIRPQRGYTYPNCMKQLEVDSSSRLEDVLAGLKMDKREIYLYSPAGIEMPLNSSLASHNIQDGDIIETCSSPMISAILSAVLADLDSVKALPEEGRSPDIIQGMLDCVDNCNITNADLNADRWTTNHLERRIICLATMKKAIQRNDRFATKIVPPCHDLHSLYNFVKDNKIFASTSNGHSTGLECFKDSATNRQGYPTICWELVQNKMNKCMLVYSSDTDLIEPFVKTECRRHGSDGQNTPSRSNANRLLQLKSRPQRNLFLSPNEPKNSVPKCDECSNELATMDADSVCLVTTCPFYSKFTCRSCFDSNHPALSSRSHERIAMTDPAARALLKKKDSYCPEFASGPFAILCALLQAQRNRKYFLNEADLKASAQLRCRSNLYDAQANGRSAFACIDTLTRKNLVRKELIHGSDDGRYSLLPEGEALAKYCLDFDTALDKVITKSCQEPPCFSRFSSNYTADILWDRREDRTLAARFQSRCLECSVQCEERELPAGDYIFRMNNYILPLVVERKTWSDFADSVQGKGNERLRLECLRRGNAVAIQSICSCQLCRMKRSKAGRILFIIEGGRCTNIDATPTNACSCVYCKELRDRHGLSQEELEQYIYRLQVEHQCLVHFTRDYNDTIMSLLLIGQIIPTVSKEKYLTYEEFCSNAQSRQAESLHPVKRGAVLDITEDEIVNILTKKSGGGSAYDLFKNRIHGSAIDYFKDNKNHDLLSKHSQGEVDEDNFVVDLTDSQQSDLFFLENDSQKKRNMDQELIEIFDDSIIESPPKRNMAQDVISYIQSPPKAKKLRTSDYAVNLKSATKDGGSLIKLIVVSGLYEYSCQYDSDVDKVWQSLYKARIRRFSDFSTDTTAKLQQIQSQHNNIPFVKRRYIYTWILYLQLHLDVILYVSRKTSCRDSIVSLWNGTQRLAQTPPVAKGPELKCSICYETLIGPNDSSFLPCTHSFHNACIQKWWTKCVVRKCPICSIDVQSETKYSSP